MTDAFEQLGNSPTVTFGIKGNEFIGPMLPDHAYYGHLWTETRLKPLAFLGFNKFRSDLPPWDDVTEFVLANYDDGEPVEYTFGQVGFQGSRITGNLKTITLAAEFVADGTDSLETFTRRDVMKKRDDSDSVRDGSDFEVTETLT